MSETDRIEICCLREEDLEGAYTCIARDYLGEESLETWSGQRRSNPELTVGCFLPGRLIGLCYGHSDPPDGVILDGIAMLDRYADRGYGACYSSISIVSSSVRDTLSARLGRPVATSSFST